MNLFPIIQPQTLTIDTEMPLYREVKWNFDGNKPEFRNGSPIIVTGKEAVLTWAWKALNTPRFRHEIYTYAYGNEAESLIGQPYTPETKQAEAARYIRECLMVNPYITGVLGTTVEFRDDDMSITCTIQTIYGEVSLNV